MHLFCETLYIGSQPNNAIKEGKEGRDTEVCHHVSNIYLDRNQHYSSVKLERRRELRVHISTSLKMYY
jgi:hypothetical protein